MKTYKFYNLGPPKKAVQRLSGTLEAQKVAWLRILQKHQPDLPLASMPNSSCIYHAAHFIPFVHDQFVQDFQKIIFWISCKIRPRVKTLGHALACLRTAPPPLPGCCCCCCCRWAGTGGWMWWTGGEGGAHSCCPSGAPQGASASCLALLPLLPPPWPSGCWPH